MTNPKVWRVWVDTGGTFTDCLALSPEGELRRAKVLSSSALRGSVAGYRAPDRLLVRADWLENAATVVGFHFRFLAGGAEAVVAEAHPSGELWLDRPMKNRIGESFELLSSEEPPILAARLATGTPAGQLLPPMELRLATTRGTNALLESKGARTALFITRGFADLLLIGNQQRPDLFRLRIERASPLCSAIVEVPGRIAADGSELEPLELEAVDPAARRLIAQGFESAAIVLLNSYRNPAHELRVKECLLRAGFTSVSASAELSPTIHFLHRAQTAAANAYLEPILRSYLDRAAENVLRSGNSTLHVMTSSGGLVGHANYHAKDSLLSGPAAGVVGAAAAGRSAGYSHVLAFDMGGTSTDVARYAGEYDYAWRHRVGSAELLSPALGIESIAAGGGSICAYRAGALQVGPESAGASPGPACYGAGGPLTITDCNLLLGRLDAGTFGIPVSEQDARRAAAELQAEIQRSTRAELPLEPLLEGLLEIANERMADAIRGISIRKGYDPADYALVAFGGAGGQHACGVARRLGTGTVVVPPDPALLSALGLGHARLERIYEKQVLLALDEDSTWLPRILAEAETAATRLLEQEGVPRAEVEIVRRVANLRLLGQESSLPIDVTDPADLGAAFQDHYRASYGFPPEERPIEIESLRVVAAAAQQPPSLSRRDSVDEIGRSTRRRVWTKDRWKEVDVLRRGALADRESLPGPALILDPHSTILVDDGWSARIGAGGAIILTDMQAASASVGARDAFVQPVTEQLFTSRFEALVEEMGAQLQRTALSVNVKERLDFSCALLDQSGELVANAPHIPVHLGALGLCVRSVVTATELKTGDVVVTNHPGFGGSHLPDLTVITPVHSDDGRLVGYVANRAHHAEIGGMTPGSMPPDAQRLEEEGVVIPPTHIVESGQAKWSRIEALLAQARYPSRSIDENLADLRAQVAANHRGAELLRQMVHDYGADELWSQMRALTDRSERLIQSALSAKEGVYEASEKLDDGSPLTAKIVISKGEAMIDFTGTAPQHSGNLNATPAIVRSAVLYVLRLLVDESVPLNEGLLRPVKIVTPRSLLNPDFGTAGDSSDAPAVVGGNTEVSQRLVDTLLKALRVSACSQGTMNNVLWGTDEFGYYETIAGGAGAGPDYQGADGVHTHMTNTRITDAEILEHRYPVRVRRFGLRRGSGGEGARRGGDGVVREIEFTRPVRLSLLAQHRVERPYGMEGGSDGEPGRQVVIRASGQRVPLSGIDGCDVEAGDRLIVETPGGGGWGR